jgi:hypothetical protein
VYPIQYQLHELSAHLMALLERRRMAFEVWDEAAEELLKSEMAAALKDVKAQFLEVADDAQYWKRTEHALHTVFFPRYLKLAKAEHAREMDGYGIWRNGDLWSRAMYAALGLLAALIVWRTPIPDSFEFFPFLLLIVGPLIPDMQLSSARRKYDRQRNQLAQDMKAEHVETNAYRPLGVDSGIDGASATSEKQREKT